MSQRSLISVLLLGTSALSLFYIVTSLRKESLYSYRGHDFPSTLPLPYKELPEVLMIAEETVHYPLLGQDSDEEWFSLTTSDFGYLRLGPENRLFVVSMFHQIHCLRILNLAFSKASIAKAGHIQHCLNYLRQSALCSADLTLEDGNFEERDFDMERTAAGYVCKDWEAVYHLMDQYKDGWDAGTLPRGGVLG